MSFKHVLIFICVLTVAVSGCIQGDTNNTNYPSVSPNNTQTSPVPTTTNAVPGEVSGQCYHVVDGDTIDVEGVGRVRLVGVNTPERGQPGYQNATDFVKSMCLGKTVFLDIDDAKNKDKYGRTLAVVHVNGMNLNQELLKRGYAEVMYIPPSEFNPYTWASG
jgi:micrococcal nuclease